LLEVEEKDPEENGGFGEDIDEIGLWVDVPLLRVGCVVV
jgi:hypothetical protein